MESDSLIKLAIIVLLTPLWLPVLKALYEDFEGALREEGGLFGRTPTARELEEMAEELDDYESPLVNEPIQEHGFRRGSREQAGADGDAEPQRGGADRAPRRRGF